jgi:hypothetical protein
MPNGFQLERWECIERFKYHGYTCRGECCMCIHCTSYDTGNTARCLGEKLITCAVCIELSVVKILSLCERMI